MASKKQIQPFTPEQQLWWDAFKAYVPNLVPHDGRLSADGAAHMCADFATSALKEFQQRWRP